MLTFNRRQMLGLGVGALAASAVAGRLPAAADNVTGYVQSIVSRMTLPQKVGQLMVSEVYGIDPTVEHSGNITRFGIGKGVDVVRELHLGGVIYFAWTDSFTRGPEGVAALSNALQATALETRVTATKGRPQGNKVAVPLLIATDQEQGLVTRFGPPATQFPGAMALGAGRSADDARVAAAITGKELRAVGINTNFAPVADVNVNPDNPVIGVRSFSSDPALVSQMVAAQVEGYQREGGVSASAKHFPGHGDTAVDSHYGLPLITHTREEWERLDAPPFRAAIAAGIDMIMTAHLLLPAFDDSGDPATLSKPILTGLLRDELGYDGVVITDALNMEGVREMYGDPEVAVRALEAGVDILLMSPSPIEARDAVLDAVHSGRIDEAEIDRKVERVLRMKLRRGIISAPKCDPALISSVVGIPEHLSIADAVTDRTVTLVRNDGVLPMPVSGKRVLVTGWGAGTTTNVQAAFTAAGATATSLNYNSPTAADIATAVATAADRDLIVVLTNNAGPTSPLARLVNALVATGKPVVAVAVRNPYDVGNYEAPAEICTYSYAPVMPGALVRVITGEVNPTGKLPVDIPSPSGGVAYAFGHGLSY
ncbi:glycoside hydrolase family 3 protein [Tessaracoccus sp. ZS01]|uniref:glycoside hydrolase family 3 protein n=1 Tax=Tessaracoccus sp. ZS01 TaxID=1906324 RepID=UPI00096E5D22|nr:glycoside hydrolase family 3 protein [Tessaracoccus sp. ZS01]MCG6568299.1 beta-N-acetylhexosaminidase [Tessaracoccus sp. ZS01]OMG53389.1 beta-N-acetylhexosaminidase [Tessaracoccus sp. ZS01]